MINMPRADMLTVLRKLGLTTNLKLCLDAGDSASYTSGQSWLDISGNGHDFFVGNTAAVAATDPTFNGTAGNRSSSEYWSFDAGDYFTYDTTNETWMENLHKSGAKFTLAAWVQFGALGAVAGIFGTNSGGTGTGTIFFKAADDTLQLLVHNAGSSVYTNLTSATIAEDVWVFVATSVDSAAGANGGSMRINTTTNVGGNTYSSPSAGSATHTAQIAARGNGNTPLPNTSRMASFMAWEGVALTQDQTLAIFQATRGKFGV